QVRRSAAQRISRPGRRARVDPRVPGKDLQRKAAAFRARLHAARPFRKGSRCAANLFMSFPRHGEIFPSDGGASPAANAPTHRLDEFPAGYSLAGWSPPEPASASPTVDEYAVIPSYRSRSFHRTANCVLTVCVSRGGTRT